jgi:hypothetical protein
MIGDLVLVFDMYPARVEAIGDTDVYLMDDDSVNWKVGYTLIKPIPLTAEILEKNGFEKTSDRNDERGTMEKWFLPGIAYAYCFSNNEIEFEIIGYGKGSRGRGKFRSVLSFVHELQHAFRVCGIEKEIVI